jgi:type III restriction enzyme
LQRSLFDVMEDDLNHYEQAVALYLEEQAWVLAWYRNAVRLGYSIQGWQSHRVYPDFEVFVRETLEVMDNVQTPSTIYVLETKGLHLKNEDTAYKQELFELCEELSKPTPWDAVAQEFSDHKVRFQVIFEDEWRSVLNALLQPTRGSSDQSS